MGVGEEPSPGFYRTILDDLRDVVFRTDVGGRWEFLNPAWTEITGFGVAETLGRRLLDYVHPDDGERSRAAFRTLIDRHRSMGRLEVRFLTRDGGSRWVEVHARALLDDAGRLAGTAGTLCDITEHKVLEATLSREKERAQATLESIGEGVIVTEPDGRVQYLNAEALRLLGWSAEAAAGRGLDEVFPLELEDGTKLGGALCSREQGGDSGHRSGEEAWLRQPAGRAMAVAWSAVPITGAGGADPGCVVAFRDVTAQREFQRQLAYQASHDPLTGLVNRAALQEALSHEVASSERTGRSFSLIILDLDRFKIVNDNYGHAVGDRVLLAMAERMAQHFRSSDWFGRWGGEEFLCLLPDTPAHEAVSIAERVRGDLMDHSVELAVGAIPMTASFGIAAFPGDGRSSEELIRTADSRLYEAKRAGRNRVEAGEKETTPILPMGGRLQRGLGEGRIRPAYQPILDLRTGEVVGEEALSRLLGSEGEVLAADQFIEAASDLQLVHRIDEVLLRRTLERCSAMLLGGRGIDHFVNISTDLLRHRDRVDAVLQEAMRVCGECGNLMGPEKPLVIEITERELLEDTEEVHRILQPFLDYGFRIAVDDFGSGYSSFRYLADLPVSFLKIEGALVRRVTREPRVQAILRGIRDIAGELGLTTIAEMVEDEETADFLRAIGIDLAQGFHFAHPEMPELSGAGRKGPPA